MAGKVLFRLYNGSQSVYVLRVLFFALPSNGVPLNIEFTLTQSRRGWDMNAGEKIAMLISVRGLITVRNMHSILCYVVGWYP